MYSYEKPIMAMPVAGNGHNA